MKKLIKHIADRIESDPWDEVLERSDSWLIKFRIFAEGGERK